MSAHLLGFLAAAVLTLLWTPVVILLARRVHALDEPGVRKVHTRPVPRIGGVAVACPILLVVGLAYLFRGQLGLDLQGSRFEIGALLAGAGLVLLVGLLDDLKGLRARIKLLGQLAAALAVIAAGICIEQVSLAGLGTLELGLAGCAFTLFWIVGMTNAVNLIDGLDGLAAGLCAIGAGTVAVVAASTGEPVMAFLMVVALGALLAFLLFNFNPARIFLGDSGTYFLGFLLGGGSVLTSSKSTALVGLALPLVAMGIPVFDTFLAILRRALERRSFFSPDRGHIHHRLVALGLTQRKAVVLLYGLTVLVTALGMLMLTVRGVEVVAVLGALVVLLLTSFRCAGSVRLRETLAKIKERAELARQIRREREVFDEYQVRVQEATDLDTWWATLTQAAAKLDFVRVHMTVPDGNGGMREFVWETNAAPAPAGAELAFALTNGRAGPRASLRVAPSCRVDPEAAARRAALVARLVEG